MFGILALMCSSSGWTGPCPAPSREGGEKVHPAGPSCYRAPRYPAPLLQGLAATEPPAIQLLSSRDMLLFWNKGTSNIFSKDFVSTFPSFFPPFLLILVSFVLWKGRWCYVARWWTVRAVGDSHHFLLGQHHMQAQAVIQTYTHKQMNAMNNKS